jgi:potassium uptake TrkH family protein
MLHPTQTIVLAFAGVLALGTAALVLPVAKAGAGGATLMEALFTAASAVCVTGLIVVDTPDYWSPFGEVVILLLIQVGGFGVMAFASLLGLTMMHRMGLRSRLSAAGETKNISIGDVGLVLRGIFRMTIVIEGVTALVLSARFLFGYGEEPGRAAWLGVFHAVSAFNNAGFALFSDSLMGYATDPWICLPVAAGVVLGGLGFPVLMQLRKELRSPRHWNMNTRIVVAATAALLSGGTLFFLATEWANPQTLGPLEGPDKLLAGFFHSAMTRTAGFNSIDTAALDPVSWFGTSILMFIGGGPAGTAGGIKVTTFAVLFFIIYTEVRGEGAVNVLGKRLPRSTHRQAISVALLAVAAVVLSTMVLMTFTSFGLDRTLFEVISAFATVGLSTGITATIPWPGQLILVALMFLGRVGPITLATAMVNRKQTRMFALPKERPVIG